MKLFGKISKLWRNNKSYYYQRDYYYDQLLSKSENLKLYTSLTNLDGKQAVLTNKVISFSENLEFKRNQHKYLKKKFGKPTYTITNDLPFGKIIIKLFRVYIGTFKTKLELHFFQDTLIMYSYTFSYLKNEFDKGQLLNVLKEKYLNDREEEIDFNKNYIVDQNNSVIVLSDSVDFTIYFITDIKSDLFHQMNELVTNDLALKRQRVSQNERELYRRL